MCSIGVVVREVMIPKDRPLIGYRAWLVSGAGIVKSMFHEYTWLTGRPQPSRRLSLSGRRGWWAFKTNALLRATYGPSRKNMGNPYIHYQQNGRVRLWGRVVEHKHGYRAQYAERIEPKRRAK